VNGIRRENTKRNRSCRADCEASRWKPIIAAKGNKIKANAAPKLIDDPWRSKQVPPKWQ